MNPMIMSGLLGQVPAAAQAAQPPRPNMWQRIGGLFGGTGSPEEIEAMGRQGLLHAGLGILANNRHGAAGPAIGAGIQQGLLSTSQMQHQRRMMERGLHDPAGVREFEALTEGLSKEEKERARRVRLGIEGRAPSSSAKTVTFEGADGRTRTGIFDPMQRTIFGPGGETFGIGEVRNVREGGREVGAASGVMGAYPPGGGQAALEQIAASANAMIAAGIPAEQVDAWAQQQMGGGEILEGFQPAPLPVQAPRASAPSAFTSRRKEDEAAATRAAQHQADLAYADALASANIPQGFRRTADGGLEPVPGGAQAEERRQAEAAEAGKRRREQYLGTVVVQDLDRASEILDDMGDGFWSAQARTRLGGVPGTPWHDLNELIEASRATVSLQNLQELKETTGAGLGNVSEKQSELLASAYGSIRPGQSKQQLQDSINRARNIYLDIVFGHGKGPARKPLSYQDKWVPEDEGWLDDQGRPLSTFGARDRPSSESRRLRYNPQTGRLE